jgi:glycosyltransferase involved in cell wall biosynthesis
MKNILFWGRYGNYGPDYPRNRVIEAVLRGLGCQVQRFLPVLSPLADLEYVLRGGRPGPGLGALFPAARPCSAAARYARRHQVPLVFDPLISAYDKQVSERRKFAADSPRARRLLAWESRLFQAADILVADTQGHADYYREVHGVAVDKLRVIPVGAEEALFRPAPLPQRLADAPLQLAFFGTFIGLQGVEVLAEAIRGYDGPPVHWRLIGEGPLKEHCQTRLNGVKHSPHRF